MDLDELKAERHRIKNDLEGILGTFKLSETEVYFIHRKDIESIKELIQVVDNYYEKEIRQANTGMIAPDEMKLYELSDKDRKKIDRIVEHAEQYKESGVVKYRIQDQYMTSQEVKEAIKKYLKSKFLNQFDSKFLSLKFPYLDKHNLSAKQTIIIEEIFDKLDKRKEKEKNGVIYFDPTGDLKIYEVGNRLINCALGRGRKSDTVSGEDVIEAKDKYFRKGEAGLDEFRERLRMEMREKNRVNYRTFSDYEPVIKLLEKYMAAINQKLYVIDGLKSATPIHLV